MTTPIKPRPRQPQRRVNGKMYLDQLAQAYLTDRKLSGASRKWLEESQKFFNTKALPALCFCPVDELTYTDVLRFINKHYAKRMLATRQRYMAYLHAVFNFGTLHELTGKNPLTKWKRKPEPKRRFQLTKKDLETLLAHCAPHLRWAIWIEWEIAARPGPSELLALTWEHVNFEQGTLHIPGTKTELSDRYIPLSPEFLAELKQRRKTARSAYLIEYKGKPIKSMKTALKAALRRAGISYGMRLYDIRHLVVTTMLTEGADLQAVSRMIGHACTSTTHKWYYHLLPGEMTRAIKRRPALSIPQEETGAQMSANVLKFPQMSQALPAQEEKNQA